MSKIPADKQNEAYWKQREAQEQAWIRQQLANDEQFNKQLEQMYQNTLDKITKEVEAEYYRLSAKEGISLKDAMKKVEDFEVREYQEQARQLVKHAQEIYKKNGIVRYEDFPEEVNSRLRIYNATMRINRLEYLKSKVGLEALRNGINVIDKTNDRLTNDYIQTLKRQAGILGESTIPDPRIGQIIKVVLADIGNANFSQRLWRDIDVLKAQLDEVLTKSLIVGNSNQQAARELRKRMSDIADAQRFDAERIVRTESARIESQATLQSLNKYGFKYVKWNIEPGACKTCVNISEADPDNVGEQGVYSINDVPFLPAHPNCRCSLSAYWVDDNIKLKDKLRSKDYPEVSDNTLDDLTQSAETWARKLTPQQQTALKDYMKYGYDPMNTLLREGKNQLPEKEVKQVSDYNNQLRTALNMASIPANLKAFRGVSPEEYSDFTKEIGKVKTFPDFKSVTLDEDIADEFGEYGKVVRFNISKGTSGQYVQPFSEFPDEQEVLLNSGTKYTVQDTGNGIEVFILGD